MRYLLKLWLIRLGVFIGLPIAINKIGELLNWAVITANGGRMPVDTEDIGLDTAHIIWHSGMHLHWLCDYIPIGHYIFSPGDLMILAGAGAAMIGFGGIAVLLICDLFPPLKGH